MSPDLGIVISAVNRLVLLAPFLLLAGCHSFTVPKELRQVRVGGIKSISLVGFDRVPDVADGTFRESLKKSFNTALEEAGAKTNDPDGLEVTFTQMTFLFEAQRFTLNQFNPFSRDAYLFAQDVQFGCLFRFSVSQAGREIVPETNFVLINDKLYYFERSSILLWPITVSVFPYYDYYYYDGAAVSDAFVTRVLERLMTVLGEALKAPPADSEGLRKSAPAPALGSSEES